jgi:hypothetical protein
MLILMLQMLDRLVVSSHPNFNGYKFGMYYKHTATIVSDACNVKVS